MKNTTYGVILFFFISVSACSSDRSDENISEQSIVEPSSQKVLPTEGSNMKKESRLEDMASKEKSHLCYQNISTFKDNPNNKDVVELKLTISGSSVIGEYNYLPAFKDQRIGQLEGGLEKKNIIKAKYSYEQEGEIGTAQISITLNNDSAIISGGDPALGLTETLTETSCKTSVVPKPIDAYACRNGAFPSYQEDFYLGRVNIPKKARSYFHDDVKNCPYRSSCKQKAYLISGNEVLVAKTQDGWSCVWYQGKKKEYVGWMQSKNIKNNHQKQPSLSEWVGDWKYYDSPTTLSISKDEKKQGSLVVSGMAYWHGSNNVVHTGGVEGVSQPLNNILNIMDGNDDFACKVSLVLLNKYLVVSDNRQCGGMNVNFDAVYVKSP